MKALRKNNSEPAAALAPVSDNTSVLRERTPVRELLIQDAMGLRFDPFVSGYSEREAVRSWDFASVYIQPQPNLIEKLLTPCSTVLLADYGLGKTAARFALEHLLRNSSELAPTLCVTYTPAPETLIGYSDEYILQRYLEELVAAAVIDLLIQTVERLDSRSHDLSDEQYAVLGALAAALPFRLKKSLKQINLNRSGNDTFLPGQRAVVRRTSTTSRWRQVMSYLKNSIDTTPSQPLDWRTIVEYTATLGFSRIYVLVDAIDSGQNEQNELHEAIAPLLRHLKAFQSQGVFLKCFLPAPLDEIIRTRYERPLKALTVPGNVVTIRNVSEDKLKRIVAERLRRASARRGSVRSIDWLQADEIEGSIEQVIAQHANGSPREMLRLIDLLLDYFCKHDFDPDHELKHPRLSANTWTAFCELLTHEFVGAQSPDQELPSSNPYTHTSSEEHHRTERGTP